MRVKAAVGAARARALDALLARAAALELGDPFAASAWLARADLGAHRPAGAKVPAAEDAAALLAFWASRERGNPAGDMRYRWELSHARAPLPAFASDPERWQAWRPREQRALSHEPCVFEARFSVPVVVADVCELLARVAEREGDDATTAAGLLAEAEPAFRRDLAQNVQALQAWSDTFALYCLAKRPRALARLRPIAVALASSYAALAHESGRVLGSRFPFHEQPLVSASAQLATGLLALGLDVPLVARLLDFVVSSGRRAGGWADAGEPADTMTTLVAADLACRLDPALEVDEVLTFVLSKQSSDGLFRAFGPDALWTTSMVIDLLDALDQPFGDRFRWPHVAATDHKTGLPFYSYYSDLAELFATLPSLARTEIEVAFLDLAGFRAFNNRFGQDAGDDVLAELASALSSIEGTRTIRDGGDEMLIVGAPTAATLFERLDAFRRAWPRRFHARFGADVPPVAPRILVGRAHAGELVRLRETLGRAIGGLKQVGETPPPEGVLARI